MKTTITLITTLLILANEVSGQVKKFDLLIKNATVIDVINRKVLEHKNICIRDGKIAEINDVSKSKGYYARIIDGTGFIAIPGFVNTHTHLWQHICKACFPKEALQTWVKIYNPIHCLTKKELHDVVLAACAEAVLSGITTVSDYASLSFNDYSFEENAKAIREAGLGGVLVYNNPSVFLPDSFKLKEIPALQRKYKDKFDIWMGYGPLSFYSIPQVYSGVVLGQKLGMNFTEHSMENNREQRDFYDLVNKYFNTYSSRLSSEDNTFLQDLLKLKRPSDVDAYEDLLRSKKQILDADEMLVSANDTLYKPLNEDEKRILNSLPVERLISPFVLLEYFGGLKNFLAIHSVWPQREDMDIFLKHNISVSHNPESNAYLSSGIAPINEYLKAHIPITIGTDGAASNDGINMFTAMREMWNLYKLRFLNTEVTKNIQDWDILQAATINGAEALFLDNKTGSIDVGKEADLMLMSKKELGMSPLRPDKVISLLIYSGNSRNVKYVISDGKILVENGRLKNFDEGKLSESLSKIANDADRRVTNGKLWSNTLTITSKNFKNYLYRYRSVRSPDSVDLKVINQTVHTVKVSVMASGAVFGGGTPTVVDKQIADRFPQDMFKKSFKEVINLAPKQTVTVIKKRGGYFYSIKTPDATLNKETGSGQLLLLIEDNLGEEK